MCSIIQWCSSGRWMYIGDNDHAMQCFIRMRIAEAAIYDDCEASDDEDNDYMNDGDEED